MSNNSKGKSDKIDRLEANKKVSKKQKAGKNGTTYIGYTKKQFMIRYKNSLCHTHT